MAQEGKVLSQSEIDALLAAFNEAAENEEDGRQPQVDVEAPLPQNVRIYDFRRPSKVSKEQLRALTSIHEALARMLTTTLTSQLQLAVQVSLSSVDQSNYEDYTQGIGENSVVSVISLDPLPQAIIWEISEDSAYSMVDRLLGGEGKPMEISRELTDIEIALLKGVVRTGLSSYRDAWGNIVELDPTLEETQVGLQYVQVALATDTVLVAVFQLQINDDTGAMTMCIPYSVLEPIIGKLSASALYGTKRRGDGASNMTAIINSLQRVDGEVKAVIGNANLSFSEVMQLNKDDVLVLDQKRDEPIVVYVGEQMKFTAIPKKSGKNLAVKLEDITQDYEIPEDLVDSLEMANAAIQSMNND